MFDKDTEAIQYLKPIFLTNGAKSVGLYIDPHSNKNEPKPYTKVNPIDHRFKCKHKTL